MFLQILIERPSSRRSTRYLYGFFENAVTIISPLMMFVRRIINDATDAWYGSINRIRRPANERQGRVQNYKQKSRCSYLVHTSIRINFNAIYFPTCFMDSRCEVTSSVTKVHKPATSSLTKFFRDLFDRNFQKLLALYTQKFRRCSEWSRDYVRVYEYQRFNTIYSLLVYNSLHTGSFKMN